MCYVHRSQNEAHSEGLRAGSLLSGGILVKPAEHDAREEGTKD